MGTAQSHTAGAVWELHRAPPPQPASNQYQSWETTITATNCSHSKPSLTNSSPRPCLFPSEVEFQILINHNSPLIPCLISFCRNHHHCHAVSTTSSPCCLEFQSAGHPSRRRKSQARASYLPSAQSTASFPSCCCPVPVAVSSMPRTQSRKTQLAVQSPATQSCNSQPLQ